MAYQIHYSNDSGRIAGLYRTREGAQSEVQNRQRGALESATERYERAGEPRWAIDQAIQTWSVDEYEIREILNTPDVLEQLANLAALGITD